MNIMLDLETLGIKPGCVILSFAAVPFESKYAEDINPFYSRISVQSSRDLGLIIEPNTEAWWRKQPVSVVAEAMGGTSHIINVLNDFADYCKNLPTAPIIWGNGVTFDNMILAEAYRRIETEVPWNYKNEMCYRTLKNLFPMFKQEKPEIAHHALYDAKAQAKNAERIIKWLHSRG